MNAYPETAKPIRTSSSFSQACELFLKNLKTQIISTRMYRAIELEERLGKKCVQTLKQTELRSVGGWCSGQIVIDSFKHAWQIKA